MYRLELEIQIDSGDIRYRVTSVATKPSPSRSRTVEHLADVWQTRNGAESSNPVRSTFQSPDFWRCQRIDRKARVCARFAITRGRGERLQRRESWEFGKTYPRAILLGPWKFARSSPIVSERVARANRTLLRRYVLDVHLPLFRRVCFCDDGCPAHTSCGGWRRNPDAGQRLSMSCRRAPASPGRGLRTGQSVHVQNPHTVLAVLTPFAERQDSDGERGFCSRAVAVY